MTADESEQFMKQLSEFTVDEEFEQELQQHIDALDD